ncbi:MAG: hypothetical protein ACRDTE_10950 [Pseudonocardiaceae bacterium]
MSAVTGAYRSRLGVSTRDSADAWTEEADAISLPRLEDEPDARLRPSGLGKLHVEQEYDTKADEQDLLWSAEGEHEARPYQVEARGCDGECEATTFLLGESETEVREANAELRHGTWVLGPYARRGAGTKLWYWGGLLALWFGDTAGVWSAAVIHGEIVYIAFGQAFSAGLAAVCAGLVGSELKDLRMARARRCDPESLSEDELRYRRLFTGTDEGLGIVKLVGLLSLLVVALLAVGIFALRSGIEGNVSGLTFGLFAAATAIASGLLRYSAADEVADLLDSLAKRARQAEKRHLKLAAASPQKVRAGGRGVGALGPGRAPVARPGGGKASGVAGLAGAEAQSAGGRARLSGW